ncbi:Uncharacterized protein OBRU01_27313, partial [Operophtera brumata]
MYLYGEEDNGSFDGLAGLLQRREVEVGVSSIFMRADRWRVMDYVSETCELRIPSLHCYPIRLHCVLQRSIPVPSAIAVVRFQRVPAPVQSRRVGGVCGRAGERRRDAGGAGAAAAGPPPAATSTDV